FVLSFVRSFKSSIETNSCSFLALTIDSAADEPNPSTTANGGINAFSFLSTVHLLASDNFKSTFLIFSPRA
ncbi:hypothetical protein CP02DC21_1076, partial [Chlamydia psittaci 02DC21]